MRVKTLVMLIPILLVAVFASGQGNTIATAKIPFAFSVVGKVLPAGEYEFMEVANSRNIIVKSTAQGGASVISPLLTRLAAGIHTSRQDSHIVFDKVGDSYTLSEIWLPGQDGFMLHITEGKHVHRIIDTPK